MPGGGYPWRWSVVPWLPGKPAFDEPLSEAGARDLGAAIAEIQLTSVADAPVNPYRSGTLAEVAEVCRDRLHELTRADALTQSQAGQLQAIFHAGLGTTEPQRTWGHLDLHGANVLTQDGHLAGILGWANAGGADPAVDLGQAWVLVGSDRVDALLESYGTADGPLRVGHGSQERVRVAARAVEYALTLAVMHEPYVSAGVAAAIDVAQGVAETSG